MVKEKVGEVEKVEQFFRVESMFDFDNLGFTHTVDNFKVYLVLVSWVKCH